MFKDIVDEFEQLVNRNTLPIIFQRSKYGILVAGFFVDFIKLNGTSLNYKWTQVEGPRVEVFNKNIKIGEYGTRNATPKQLAADIFKDVEKMVTNGVPAEARQVS